MSSESTDLPVSEALRSMDAVLAILGDEAHWCKHARRLADGRRCLVGALQEVQAPPSLRRAVLRQIRETTGRRYVGLAAFNDDPETSHAQLLSVLRDARQKIALGEWRLEPAERSPWLRWQQLLAPAAPGIA